MRVLVIDQCSGSKQVPDWFTPYTADEIDEHSREDLLDGVRERVPALRAEKLYTGRQQQFITEACDQLRDAGDEVDRVFVSAGFGVVDENEELPPYEVTFNDYTTAEVRERGEKLGIGPDLRSLLNDEDAYDIVFVALGSTYIKSFDLTAVLAELPSETTGVLFNQPEIAEEERSVCSISARTADAKELGTIVVAVKGTYLQQFAENRAQRGEPSSTEEVIEWCASPTTSQTTLDGT